jgi:PIN domain nuclease of toxin-antitoxin system
VVSTRERPLGFVHAPHFDDSFFDPLPEDDIAAWERAAYSTHMPSLLFSHALAAGLFAVPHGDPFDRLLAAQAITEGLPLLSSDAMMAQFPGLILYW